MDALRDDEIDKIGVWGMGGVGKTTLVKQVAQLAEDEKLFTAGVYIDVSWTRDSEKLQEGIAKIQQKIADMLGLEFKGKDESTRAVELKQRLQKEKILIILDDIWKLVCLEEVGIPSKDDQKGCKIVLASRNEDLLRKDMGARECFPLQHLPKEEAWHLFKKTAGDSVEGDKLRPIAIEVVNECEGLPIAIYAMGLDLFDHLKSLEQAINKLVTLVRILKASSLLLDGEDHGDDFEEEASMLLFMDADNKYVRMHDVVRDVARNIASKDPHRFVVREDVEEWSETDGSKYISLNCKDVHELPHRLVCPKLQFFLLQKGPSLKIPHTFFEGMNLLKVLDLSEMHFTTLPSTLHSLPNLRTLSLDRCKLGDIALIGELKKLQVLSLVGSDIQQLPSEMGQLTNLRLLDLNDCEKLEVIPRNILSSLSRLECLCMKSSFTQWAAEGVSDGESNACLSELNNLRHLTTIEMQVPAVKLLPKEDMFFENLTRYAIFVGEIQPWETNYKTSKTLRLRQVDRSSLLRDGIDKLLKKTEELKFSKLFYLKIHSIFGKSLIWHHQPSLESFYNLEILEVFCCSCLLNLIPSYLIQRFNNLKKIHVYGCKVLEYTFDLQGLDENVEILPKLETLKLHKLPRLRYIICNEDKNDGMRCLFSSQTLMDFQNLKCLSIQDCAYENNEEGHVNTPIEDIVLFGEKVSFLPFFLFLSFHILFLKILTKIFHKNNNNNNNNMRRSYQSLIINLLNYLDI
ncbi:unnamed protein product, partial [Vitis vinifera]